MRITLPIRPQKWKTALTSLACAGLILTAGCALQDQAAPPTPTPCPAPPIQQDIDAALNFANGIFEPERWKLTQDQAPFIIHLLWLQQDGGGVAHQEYLLYDCGYTPDDLDNYFSEDNFNVILSGYEDWQSTTRCEADGITLYEFDLIYEGGDYLMRYWIKPLSDTRVLDLSLAFPAADVNLMNAYAVRLFPQLSSCA
jgi:hypothetical protein